MCFLRYGPEQSRLNFRRLVFGLCLFHGVCLERLDFGPIGWNDTSYSFDNSDLVVSLNQLRDAIVAMKVRGETAKSEKPQLPMKALHYLTAECFYGGRVTGKNSC